MTNDDFLANTGLPACFAASVGGLADAIRAARNAEAYL
jgi:hypothetical protein